MICIFLLIPIAIATARTAVEPNYLSFLRATGRDEEFAQLIGVPVSRVRPVQGDASYWSLRQTASIYGDIMLPPADEEGRQGYNITAHKSYRWPNNEIPYVINVDEFNLLEIIFILSGINDFNSKVSNIKLVPREKNQRDYVFIYNGNGCYAHIGKVGLQQAMSLQRNGCVTQGTVQHEFIHSIGFIHEQSRPDRDNYIRIIEENIPPQILDQYQKFDYEDISLWVEYDYYSIMHYPVYLPGYNAKTMEILQDGIDENRIGKVENLMSEKDIEKINKQYA